MKIKRPLFRLAKRLTAPLPIAVESSQRLAELRAAETRLRWQTELLEHNPSPEIIPRAQLGQDCFALWATSFAREGFFVEFGAANGITHSNSFLLERSFAWNGILAEPARAWHEELRRNRRCVIDTRCVWTQTGQQLSFAESADTSLSTISDYVDVDGHREQRRNSVTYPVETVSLNDLLAEHSAPARIDYLSVDTEGTEFEILSAFDFDRYEVRVLTVEHANNSERRDRVYELLRSRGFDRILADVSLWDDWFVNRATLSLPPQTGSAQLSA